jgi:hypothetical protein
MANRKSKGLVHRRQLDAHKRCAANSRFIQGPEDDPILGSGTQFVYRPNEVSIFQGGTPYQRQYNLTLRTSENASRIAEVIVGGEWMGMFSPEPGFEVTWLDKPRTYARKRPPFDPQ